MGYCPISSLPRLSQKKKRKEKGKKKEKEENREQNHWIMKKISNKAFV